MDDNHNEVKRKHNEQARAQRYRNKQLMRLWMRGYEECLWGCPCELSGIGGANAGNCDRTSSNFEFMTVRLREEQRPSLHVSEPLGSEAPQRERLGYPPPIAQEPIREPKRTTRGVHR